MLVADTHSEAHRVEPRVIVGVSENPAKFEPNMLIVNNPDVGLLPGDRLDIEGAEFEVLGKLIDEDTINLMDGIYIEWHNHLLKTNYDISIFIDELNSRNIEVKSWI